MIVIRELIYFMFALFLLCVLLCLLIWTGWLLNTLCKELLGFDLIYLIRFRKCKVSGKLIKVDDIEDFKPKMEIYKNDRK